MKKAILIILCITIISNHNMSGQNKKNENPPTSVYTDETGRFYLDTILIIEGIKKEILYKKAKEWVVSNVRTNDNTIVFDDEKFEEINTDMTFQLYPATSINFKLGIKVKDGKIKITTKSFFYTNISQGILYQEDFEKIKVPGKKLVYKKFDENFQSILTSLISSLKNETKSDW